ncbi:GNAT family N-acetyltransferase [uncultured Clostridium sp.]|uniref:GNAT family N-acetyltransferase n=1 Tax=uncultured Clostridium sp. TaxID=59620 RepID=UPI0025E9463D|nr:GNAT family N-acetyltransferase [uncultured Clostridium sp.]
MIREINSRNIEEITELYMDAFNNPPWNDKWTYETAGRRLQDIINTPGYIGMSYYIDGVPQGMIMGRCEQYYDGKYFQILEFCIRSSAQGSGYGRILLEEFTHMLKVENIVNVFLLTLHGQKTEGFYNKNGFITSEDMIFMSKKLI